MVYNCATTNIRFVLIVRDLNILSKWLKIGKW